MSRTNWSTNRKRQRMRRQGTDDVRGGEVSFMAPLLPPKAPKPRISKTELRAVADAALAEWEKRRG